MVDPTVEVPVSWRHRFTSGWVSLILIRPINDGCSNWRGRPSTAGQDRLPELRWGDGCLRVWNGLVSSASQSLPVTGPLPGEVRGGTTIPRVIGGDLSWETADDGPGLPAGARLACGACGRGRVGDAA